MKARIAHLFRETPILFIGTVLVIAITFRVGIGAVKTASAEPVAEPPPVVHTPVPAKAAVATAPAVQAEPTTTAPAMPEPPKPLPKRKVPRVHGKR
jgi:hypothetical protein